MGEGVYDVGSSAAASSGWPRPWPWFGRGELGGGAGGRGEARRHQTGNNSGVIHSGLYYKPGSLKAKNCVAGREALYRFCREQGIPHQACGKLVVATREDELPALAELERRERPTGLKKLRRLAAAELKEYEPPRHRHRRLWSGRRGSSTTARFAPLTRDHREQGGEIRLRFRVDGCSKDGGELVLRSRAGQVRCRNLVNCAGLLFRPRRAPVRVKPGLADRFLPREYYQLVPARARPGAQTSSTPCPTRAFHPRRSFHAHDPRAAEAGPNAVLAFSAEGYRKAAFPCAMPSRWPSIPASGSWA